MAGRAGGQADPDAVCLAAIPRSYREQTGLDAVWNAEDFSGPPGSGDRARDAAAGISPLRNALRRQDRQSHAQRLSGDTSGNRRSRGTLLAMVPGGSVYQCAAPFKERGRFVRKYFAALRMDGMLRPAGAQLSGLQSPHSFEFVAVHDDEPVGHGGNPFARITGKTRKRQISEARAGEADGGYNGACPSLTRRL